MDTPKTAVNTGKSARSPASTLLRLLMLSLVVPLLTAACGDGGVVGIGGGLEGNYELVAINGDELPANFGATLHTAGELSLQDGEYTIGFTREGDDYSESGVYDVDEDKGTISFDPDSEDAPPGAYDVEYVLDGDRLTLTFGPTNESLTFEK